MAKRTARTEPVDPNRDLLITEPSQFRKDLEDRIAIGGDLQNRNPKTPEEFGEAFRDFDRWNDYNSELLNSSFQSPNSSYRIEYDNAGTRAFGPSFAEKVGYKRDNLISLMDRIGLLRRHQPLHRPSNIEAPASPIITVKSADVFIVHGHDDGLKAEVARLISTLKLKPVILHEQPNGGKTIIEKFESHAGAAGFAIVLLTGDDEGRSRQHGADISPRARQNVIFELGFFFGKLGRDRVVVLNKGVEKPSDIDGLVYIQVDPAGHWRFSVAKELKQAGYNIDLNLL